MWELASSHMETAVLFGVGLEEASEQGSNGGFNPQDARAQLHRLQASLGQQVHLVGNPATFRADGQGHRSLDGPWAGGKVAGMADQAEAVGGNARQLVCNK